MSDDAIELWYVAEAGVRRGPFSASLLECLLSEGKFSNAALIWKSGMASWRPIGLHFPEINLDRAAHVLTPQAVPTIREIKPKLQTTSRVPWLILLAPIVLVSCGLYFLWFGAPLDDFSPDVALYLRLGTIALSGLMIAAGTSLWGRKGPFKGVGLQRVFVIIVAALSTIFLIMTAIQTPFWYRLRVARSSFDHFSVTTNVLDHAIEISGLVGPGLARKVSALLDANFGIKKIVIDSNGGLVDEAISVANVIEAHGNLVTVARHACNSACIIIFMAGDRRSAPFDLQFGFHAQSPITSIKGAYNLEALQQLSVDSNRYLRGRGVPQMYLDKAATVGPDKLFPVTAVQLAAIGVVSELTDSGSPITIDEGKWLVIAKVLNSSAATKPLVTVLSEMKEIDPAGVRSATSSMWQGLIDNDISGIGVPIRSLISKHVTRAIPAAEPPAIAELVAITDLELKFFSQSQDWKGCADFADGKGFGKVTPPPALMQREFQASADVIRSAAQQGWVKRDVPGWATSEGDKLAKEIAVQMFERGEDIRQIESSPRIKCDWSANLFARMAARPTAEAAGLYQWMSSTQ